MKKIVLLGVLISSMCYSQDSYLGLIAGFDARNAVVGSKPTGNKPAFDGLIQVAAVSNDIELTMSYESFRRIKYQRIGIGGGYHFDLYADMFNRTIKTTVIPNVEACIIYRKQSESFHLSEVYDPVLDDGTRGFVTIVYNATASWNITDKLLVQVTNQFMRREDLVAAFDDKRIKYAAYLKFGWRFN